MSEDQAGPTTPTVCIAMIVKNEASVIERCLDSALPVADRWLIIDTGSTDNTCELIEKKLAELPGELLRSKWRDFGTNRSELLREARGTADWLLLLDADCVVEHDPGWETALDRKDLDAFMVDVVGDGSMTYGMPYLVRGDKPWRYEGVTHEYITCDLPTTRERIDGLRIRHHADGGSRADKFERDRQLLTADLAINPDNPRTVFYLAQTHRDLGDREKAIELYLRRAGMAGWEEETFFAQYQAGVLLMKDDWAAAVPALLAAFSMRPTRAEPLYQLARGYEQRQMYAPAYLFAEAGMAIPIPTDALFVETYIYEWGLRFERSVAAWYVGNRELCRSDSIILRDRPVPEPWLSSVKANLELFARG